MVYRPKRDTETKVRVGKDDYMTLTEFVGYLHLYPVPWAQVHSPQALGKYTVFVLVDGTVVKAHITGLSETNPNAIRTTKANRSRRRFDVRRGEVKAIYQ
jgi:hypothetical protein